MLHIKLMRITHRQHTSNDSVLTHTLDPWSLKIVMLHMRLKGMKRTITRKQIICPYTHPKPLGRV